jgi:hypothetical protein
MRRDFEELKTLFVRYVKDETLQPIKDLGRFVLWGVVGSLFVAFGAVLLLLGTLRFLQEQFSVLNGTLSWLPYLIVAVLCVAVLALTTWRVLSGTAKRRLKTSK